VSRNFSFTLDYSINLKDRVVLSTEIASAGNTALDQILTDNNLSDLSFLQML
jgi:iron complex outermembrane receptor protein